MCGITGVFAFNEIGRFHIVRLQAATDALEHRGPDSGRIFSDYFVGLGHRRLAIIDLSSDASQPMQDESDRYVLVFNGEIFNYQSLKNELIAKGYNFFSDSDTEVLLKLYIEEGEKCLQKLNGFFAFAIYDKQENSIFIARDRFGIKPLYYYQDEDKFVFASEMDALLTYNLPKVLNFEALQLYFQLHYVPAPHSILKNIYKLEPGHSMRVRKRKLEIQSFYEIPNYYKNQNYPIRDYETAKKQLLEIFEDAVRLRLVADVPIAAFLSGGTDSSAVVAMASRHTSQLNTFSIGYEDEPLFDETAYAELVAKTFKTQHRVFKLSNQDIFAAVEQMLPSLSEPFADSSAIPFYLLSQKTRAVATVALSGDGSDEIFAGYNKYAGEYRVRQGGMIENLLKANVGLLEKLPKSRNGFLSNKFRQMHRFAQAAHLDTHERYWWLSTFASEAEVQSLFGKQTQARIATATYREMQSHYTKHLLEKGDMNDMLYADMHLLLPNDMLTKADSMSMASSLEVRVPFLDHRLVEFAFSISSDFKINKKIKKRILQDAFRPILPEKLYNRAKHGFDVPLLKGFQTVLKPLLDKYFDADSIEAQGIFEVEAVQKLKAQALEGKNIDQNRVWAMLVFQHWFERYRPKLEEPLEQD
ncbi:MAG: asparagine synthase (glutamine-hydrolyzing) [Bernardetiaceae bacterium]|nr:asparagine synthase (glutamine-hydrolyzing) [Bernardetiaceae bacterium]